MNSPNQVRQRGYCALCWSSCGCISVVEDGKLVAVEPDPDHPTGEALCGKGQAAPEYVYSDARILYPMKRTRPKGARDPGWERISWDEALDTTAEAIKHHTIENGSESVAFSVTTSAGTAMQDSYPFIERLRHAVGSPNEIASIELCDFSKDFVYPHTFGTQMPTSEVENSDCVILWGHNPGTTWLAFARRITKAVRRGVKLIVMDPMRVGFAAKADQWLRVRPGSDGALALSMAHVMIEENLFNKEFVAKWTNGPFLINKTTDKMLSGDDLGLDNGSKLRFAWDKKNENLIRYDVDRGDFIDEVICDNLMLHGEITLETKKDLLTCEPAFAAYAKLCAEHPPEKAAEITWLDADQIRETARIIGTSKAVSCYAWAGLEMHSNTSQTGRAIQCFYALTGCFDAPGGNVMFEQVPVNTIFGQELLPDDLNAKPVGQEQRPIGPESIFGWITTDGFYKAVLDKEPYDINALISFGLNMLVSHADGERGKRALEALDFMAHADLFMTPTAQNADIIFPVNTPWEREGLKTDFYADQSAISHLQFREQVIEPLGESKSDAWIATELAKRLGYGSDFWDGDFDAACRHILEPSGVALEKLRNTPGGVNLALKPRYRKYAETADGNPKGFGTPSKRVELYCETFATNGYDPLPHYVEPAVGPYSRPDLSADYPLVITDTKSPHFIHSQYRHVGRLRRHEREPRIEMHPSTADARGIQEGELVEVRTPHAGARMRARLTNGLDPRVVRATAGWWQACDKLSLSGYDALSDEGANYNRMIGNDSADPVGGCTANKSYLCEIKRLAS
ncbi:MAG: molybdopterin-dependent oxidoreductase [Pseudomonadota bacterium]